MTPRKTLVPLFAILLVLAGCNRTEPTKANPPPESTAGIALLQSDLYTVELQDIGSTLALTGTLKPRQSAQIRAKAGGVIAAQYFREGDAIRAGQVFARLDDTETKLQLAEKQASLSSQAAQLTEAKDQLDNNERLAAQGFVSNSALIKAKAAYDSAKAQLAVQQAQLAIAKQALADRQIVAPFSGIVGEVQTQAGSKVSTDGPVFQLINLDVMDLQAEVAPNELPRLSIGQMATIESAGQTRQGKLVRISPGNLDDSRSVSVFLQIDNKDHALRAGQFATATLQTGDIHKGVLIAQGAVREDQGNTIVYVLKNNTLEARQVTTGNASTGQNGGPNRVEILKGLSVGEQIVGVNLGPLATGVPVKLQTVKR